jgi:alpha-glucosidase
MFILFTEIQLKTTFMFQKIICIAATFLLLTACQKATTSQTEGEEELTVPPCVVSSPPDSLHLDKFYSKYVDVNGLPLISSWRVPDSCFVAAHRTLYAMTSMLAPEIIEAMKKANARVAIMARYEGTTDLPEHHYLINDTALNWDLRARGLGGTIEEPLTSCAEENILAYQIDKYHAEDILIHEFAHAIHCIGIIQVDSTFDDRLQKLYEQAKARGILAGTYRETDRMEYFAEGVQDWFNVNAEMPHTDGKHNWCNTREELQVFDPDLYNLIAEFFPKTQLQISKHAKVNQYTKP